MLQELDLTPVSLTFHPDNLATSSRKPRISILDAPHTQVKEGPASFIREALDALSVSRIDHGIKLKDDLELMQRLSKDGTLLTMVCSHL